MSEITPQTEIRFNCVDDPVPLGISAFSLDSIFTGLEVVGLNTEAPEAITTLLLMLPIIDRKHKIKVRRCLSEQIKKQARTRPNVHSNSRAAHT